MADQISNSTKLEVTRTSRGFAVAMGVDLYAEPYSIQDSSLAEEAAIWLGRDADTGGRAHLTQDMAAGLIPLLQAFVATGSIAGSADTIAAPPAMDREAVERVREAAYRQALEDVCNPLGYLQRMADAEGAKLSGMAYAIASDIGTIQRIAKEALSTLSADAIRQGEGERGFCNKCGFVGVPQKGGFHYRPKDGQPCNYICPVSATPASHASDGGKA